MRTLTKKQILAAIVATAFAGSGLLTACGSDGDDATPASKPDTATSAPAEPSPTAGEAPSAPTSAADLVLSPGAAGPVKVGMSAAEVAATELFDTDVPTGNEECPTEALAWKAPFKDALDVQALDNGAIASIGVWKAGPKTESGLGVGSTLAEVLAAYPGAKTVAAGYGQTGVLIQDAATNGWIGFLFDAELKDAKDADKVSFIELTEGEKPSLQRDGC